MVREKKTWQPIFYLIQTILPLTSQPVTQKTWSANIFPISDSVPIKISVWKSRDFWVHTVLRVQQMCLHMDTKREATRYVHSFVRCVETMIDSEPMNSMPEQRHVYNGEMKVTWCPHLTKRSNKLLPRPPFLAFWDIIVAGSY